MSKQSNRTGVSKNQTPIDGTPIPNMDGGETPDIMKQKEGITDQGTPNSKASELETLLMNQGLIDGFILKPSDIIRVLGATRMKDELVNILQDLYKPASQFDEEKVEYNKINILAEYHMYNIIYAKTELMFDEFRIAVVCNIFWKILEFDPEQESQKQQISQNKLKNEPNMNIKDDLLKGDDAFQGSDDHKAFPVQKNQMEGQTSQIGKESINAIEFRGDGIDEDKEFEETLTNKFNLFRNLIMKYIHLKNPALSITKQEAKRLIEYAQESYFKHLRLYEFTFNNKAPSEMKRINFIKEEAIVALPLSSALQISAGRPQAKESIKSDSSQNDMAEDAADMGEAIGDMDPEMAYGDEQMDEMSGMEQEMEAYEMEMEQDGSLPDTGMEKRTVSMADPLESNREAAPVNIDLENTNLSNEQKNTLTQGLTDWDNKLNDLMEKRNAEFEDKLPQAKKK